MHRHLLVRVLLVLVLLISQQMAMAHALSHWDGGEGIGTSERDCGQCSALDQFDAPLGQLALALLHPLLSCRPLAAPAPRPPAARTCCVFLSRAPPRA